MTPFDRLHPALKHHVVNSLGWDDLRPFQQAVIDPVLAGRHLLILAPTAGGKTEGAFFPVLSRMLMDGWIGLSVLYVCPIKALLNRAGAGIGAGSILDQINLSCGCYLPEATGPTSCSSTEPGCRDRLSAHPFWSAGPSRPFSR